MCPLWLLNLCIYTVSGQQWLYISTSISCNSYDAQRKFMGTIIDRIPHVCGPFHSKLYLSSVFNYLCFLQFLWCAAQIYGNHFTQNCPFSMDCTCLFRKEIVKKLNFNGTEKNRSKNLTIRIKAGFWRFLFFWHFFNKFISPDFWVKYSFFSSFPISLKIDPFRWIARVYLGRKLSKS